MSNGVTTNVTTNSSAATAKPDTTSADQTTLALLSADIDNVMQRTIDAWKNEAMSNNHSDDYLLADILQRSEHEQPNMFFRCLGLSLFFGMFFIDSFSFVCRSRRKSNELSFIIPSDFPTSDNDNSYQ